MAETHLSDSANEIPSEEPTETDSFSALEEQIERRKTRDLSVPPIRPPEYRVATNTIQFKALGLFDSQGHPVVASAREITPDEDNPFTWPMRWGIAITGKLLKSRVVWPLNIGNNPLLFYYLGRKVRLLGTDILLPLIFLLMAAAFWHSITIIALLGGGYLMWVLGVFFLFGFTTTAFASLVQYTTAAMLRRHITEVFLNDLRLTPLSRAQVCHAVMMRVLGPVAFWLVVIAGLGALGWIGVFWMIVGAFQQVVADPEVKTLFLQAAILFLPWVMVTGLAAFFGCKYAVDRWFLAEEEREDSELVGERVTIQSLNQLETRKVVLLFLFSGLLMTGAFLLSNGIFLLVAFFLIYCGYKGVRNLYGVLVQELKEAYRIKKRAS